MGIKDRPEPSGRSFFKSALLAADDDIDDAFCFHYNANGEMVSYTYKTASGETECFLVKNQQGDVEKVISADGTVLAAYTYDAWGNILSATGSLANANPIRYRGYYFDSETGLYYLHSRYYDPEVRRFINADDAAMLGADGDVPSYNLFAYSGNNPVSKGDTQGKLANWLIGGVVGAAVGGLTALIKGENVVAGAAQGAISGAIAGAAVDVALSVVATCGIAGVAIAGVIAFVGGAGGNALGEDIGSLIQTGHVVQDRNALFKRSMIAGGINTVSLGFSSTLKYADEGIKGFNQSKQLPEIVAAAKRNIMDFSFRSVDIVSTFSAVHFTIHNLVLSTIV